MMGNDFWADLEIDAFEKQLELEAIAKTLIDHWGKELTENDLLKMKAYTDSQINLVETAIAKAALAYYLTQDYSPEFIHKYQSSPKKSWITRIFTPVVQLVRTHRS